MTEWPIVLAWKASVRASVPWVRIPLSPPIYARRILNQHGAGVTFRREERWQSGRLRRSRKPLIRVPLIRGFESHPLRQPGLEYSKNAQGRTGQARLESFRWGTSQCLTVLGVGSGASTTREPGQALTGAALSDVCVVRPIPLPAREHVQEVVTL